MTMSTIVEDDFKEDDILVFQQPTTADPFGDVDVSHFMSKERVCTVTVTEEAKVQIGLARQTDAARHKAVPIGIARAIARGRIAVNMTQKQLSTRLNMDNKLIAAIEAGTAVYNPSDLHRIRIFLGLPKWT